MSHFARALEARIPPPIVMLLMGTLAWIGARYLPSLSFQLPSNGIFSSVFAIAGLFLNLYPKLAFDRAGTTINPLKPGSTTHLVTSGLYRYTRNPMYLGQWLILLGWTVYLHNFIGLLVLPAFVVYISYFQIRPEERQLSVLFPSEFAAFCGRSRRWL
jgi:protein-S-isoprenylcysteine O-methyltransferase Ste14